MVDLYEMFALTRPLAEIIGRSIIGYVALVALIRIVPKRNAGHISPNDMLVLIVVGTIGADAITSQFDSLGDLLLTIATILMIGYLSDLLEFRSPWFRRLMRQRQTLLVSQGKMIRENMRRETVTEEELFSALRLKGVDNIERVSSAVLEPDGEISVQIATRDQ